MDVLWSILRIEGPYSNDSIPVDAVKIDGSKENVKLFEESLDSLATSFVHPRLRDEFKEHMRKLLDAHRDMNKCQ